MPIKVQNNGQNNVLDISAAALASGTGLITMNGNNNFIWIQDSSYQIAVHVYVHGGGLVQIGKHLNSLNLIIYLAENAELNIGNAVSFNGTVRILLHEPSTIHIGDHCLFGGEVDITASDMHSILDAQTRRRINPARPVVIGQRVWVGQKATILKGVTIGDGAIIGASAVVTKPVQGNCVAAGNPAEIVKTGVTWDIRLL